MSGKVWLLGCCAIALLTGCSGDPTAERWFAPDPELETPASPQASPSPTPSPTPEEEETAQTLPQNFPETIPQYPEATLLEATYSSAQVRGTTRWQTTDPQNLVREFYQQAFRENDWTLETEEGEEDSLSARQGDLRVTIAFEEVSAGETQFRLTYQVGESPTPTTSEGAGDLSGVSEPLRGYVADVLALGVIGEVNPNETVTRRTFARWLFEVHNRMYSDRTTKQIRPIPTRDRPAFQDIPPSDPDFALIQGLAEAGIIPSRLTDNSNPALFQPDAPLTRENLLLWKVPLDVRKPLPQATVSGIEQTWGFQDAAQVNPEALRALAADYENGDRANILRVFGYTTLFQPKKPVTQAEAIASLWYFGHQGEGISAPEAANISP
ncbi:S-layer homology domain-containing protein [Spirulina subsalsa]|uniref:S-layer homology domain-containing protein n=1 Tax=Spirulina subsalsa TaxID=54311 RepID=UPI0002D32C44|nr:S-layer homology domain-containing protein [Spirulina subsalsa]